MRYIILLVLILLCSCKNNEVGISKNEKVLEQKIKISLNDIKYVYKSSSVSDTNWFDLSEIDTSILTPIDTTFFRKYIATSNYKMSNYRRWFFKSVFENDSILVSSIIKVENDEIDGNKFLNDSGYYLMIINKVIGEVIKFTNIESSYFSPIGGKYSSISQKSLNNLIIDSFDEYADEKTTTNTYYVNVVINDNYTLIFDTLKHTKTIN